MSDLPQFVRETQEAPAIRPSADRNAMLSTDVRWLGNLLGQTIVEQHGQAALDLVEHVRALAKTRRRNDVQSDVALENVIRKLNLDEQRILIKAFGNYFQLINIAEDLQRIRVLTDRERNGIVEESIEAAIRTLRARGLSATEVHALLQKINVRLVLTAHPS